MFLWATLTVKNLNESIKFYTDIVGLEVVERITAGPGLEIAFLGKGETKVELKSSNGEETHMGKDVSLGFAVDSLDEKIKFIESKGISIHSGPFAPNPHTRFFYIKDPDGIKIQFLESK